MILWFSLQKEVFDLLQEVEREKAARLDLERTARVHSTAVSEQAPIERHNSGFENGMMLRIMMTLIFFYFLYLLCSLVQEACPGNFLLLAALEAWRKVIFCKHLWGQLIVSLKGEMLEMQL